MATLSSCESSPEYLIARRSLQISPCDPTREDIDDFLKKELDMPDESVQSMSMVHFREIIERNLPPHRAGQQKKKVEIELETIDDRDIILSYASNLSRGSSINVVVPDKLRALQV